MPNKELELQWTKEQEEYVARLKEQIKKTKCCGNCKHYYCSNDTKGKCNLRNPKENKCGFNICEKWELADEKQRA